MSRDDRHRAGARIRAKAGLPWPVTGTYVCDKCGGRQFGESGVITARCKALRDAQSQLCNCAYFSLIEMSDRVTESDSQRIL